MLVEHMIFLKFKFLNTLKFFMPKKIRRLDFPYNRLQYPIYSRSRPGIDRVWEHASGFIHFDCKYRYCCQFYRELRDYAWAHYDRPTESWADDMAERCYRIAEKKKEDSIQKMYQDYRRENYNPNSPNSPMADFNELFRRHAGNVYEHDRNEVYWQDGPKGFVMPVNKEIIF